MDAAAAGPGPLLGPEPQPGQTSLHQWDRMGRTDQWDRLIHHHHQQSQSVTSDPILAPYCSPQPSSCGKPIPLEWGVVAASGPLPLTIACCLRETGCSPRIRSLP